MLISDTQLIKEVKKRKCGVGLLSLEDVAPLQKILLKIQNLVFNSSNSHFTEFGNRILALCIAISTEEQEKKLIATSEKSKSIINQNLLRSESIEIQKILNSMKEG